METFNAMRRRSTSNLNTDSKDSKGIHLRVNTLILGLIGTCFSFLGFPPARAFWFYIYFFGLTWYRTPTTRTHLWIWTLLDIIFDYSSNVNSLPNISGQIECNCSNNISEIKMRRCGLGGERQSFIISLLKPLALSSNVLKGSPRIGF